MAPDSAPADLALRCLRSLTLEQRTALGGALAVLLGRHVGWYDAEDAADAGPAERFSGRLLRTVMCDLLELPDDQFTALEPLSRLPPGDIPLSPDPFIISLPNSPEQREAIVHGLVVLMAVGVAIASVEAAQHVGNVSNGTSAPDTCTNPTQIKGVRVLSTGYDARSRQVLVELSAALGVPWHKMARREAELASALSSQLHEEQSIARAERETRAHAEGMSNRRSMIKRWKHSAAIVGVGIASGAAVALTAGLAAPAVIGGLAAVGGGISALGAAGAVVGTAVGSLTVLLSGTTGVAVITSIFGATGAGLAAYKMDRRLADVSEFHFLQPNVAQVARAQYAVEVPTLPYEPPTHSNATDEPRNPAAVRVTQRLLLSSNLQVLPPLEVRSLRQRLAAALEVQMEEVAIAVDATASPIALEVSLASANSASSQQAIRRLHSLSPDTFARVLHLPVVAAQPSMRHYSTHPDRLLGASPTNETLTRVPALSVFIGISGWLEPGADAPTSHWWRGGPTTAPAQDTGRAAVAALRKTAGVATVVGSAAGTMLKLPRASGPANALSHSLNGCNSGSNDGTSASETQPLSWKEGMARAVAETMGVSELNGPVVTAADVAGSKLEHACSSQATSPDDTLLTMNSKIDLADDISDAVEWLASMGFEEERAAEAARSNRTVEAMVEDLVRIQREPPKPERADIQLVPQPHATLIEATALDEIVTASTGRVTVGGAVVQEAATSALGAGCQQIENALRKPAANELIQAIDSEDEPTAEAVSPEAAESGSIACEQGDSLSRRFRSEHLRVSSIESNAATQGHPENNSVLELFAWSEHHALIWETSALKHLGGALSRLAATEALSVVAAQTLKHTFFASLMAAVAVPAYIMKACDVLDNPWGVAYLRARRAGKLLARILVEREQGARPVILVGFSLGALVVWECLHEMCRLSEEGRARAAGVVQHAVMMGLPAGADFSRWLRLRRVVAGRLINCYRPDDLVLALVHRGTSATSFRHGVAGLSPVVTTNAATMDIESFDVSHIVHAHHKYRSRLGAVLQHIGLTE